jgi:TonB family protein
MWKLASILFEDKPGVRLRTDEYLLYNVIAGLFVLVVRSRPMLRIVPILGLLLALVVLQWSAAQAPSDKPDAPTPKTTPAWTGLPQKPQAAEREKRTPEAQKVADLPALGASIAAYISVAGCQPKICTVLVTNFTLPDGDTTAYGMQIADTLSRELKGKEYKLRMIDRGLLQEFVAKERVPAQPEHRTVIRWISDGLGARFIVVGTTEKIDSGLVSLSTQLIDTDSKEWRVYSAIVNLGPLDSPEGLEPVEPFAPLPPITTSLSGEKLERVGVNGTTTPSCFYSPNPPYSEEARKLKLNGSVTAETVINSRGELENVRIVRGAPAGLNETTIAALRTWRCNPAMKDGKPVPVLVPITTNFRMY